eukprot:scpid5996/ scgid14791/ 
MNRRYSWTSYSEDESDVQREPDWQEVKFPLKFPQDAVEQYDRLEWSVEVTTPDQEIIPGVARPRNEQVNIKFQPFQEGVHQVQVLANGRPFCPALYFNVLDDGTVRRIAAPPGANDDLSRPPQQQQQQRNRQLKKKRDRPSKTGSAYSDEDEDIPSVGADGRKLSSGPRRQVDKNRQQEQRLRKQSGEDGRGNRHNGAGYHSGYQPSESDQYEARGQRRGPSVERANHTRRRSSSRQRSEEPPMHRTSVSHTQSPTGSNSARAGHHRRSVSQSSYDRSDILVASPGGGGGGGRESGRISRTSSNGRHSTSGRPGLQRRSSSLSRYGSDQDAGRPVMRKASSASRQYKSDTESILSRQNSFNQTHRSSSRASSTHRRQSRPSSAHYSSNDEYASGFRENSGRRRSRTTSDLHDAHRTRSPPPAAATTAKKIATKYKSTSNIRQGPRVSAFAFGAMPAQTGPTGAYPPPLGMKKSNSQDHGTGLAAKSTAVEADFEVISSPNGEESYILKGQRMLSVRKLGRSAKGDELVQADSGEIFLIRHGRAVPMQQGFAAVADTPPSSTNRAQMVPLGKKMSVMSLSSAIVPAGTASQPALVQTDGKPRCSVCNKKVTSAKQRAVLQGYGFYCHKHFKELFFHKPADSHKKFLFVDLTHIPSPGNMLHPRANFTALSFKQFLRAQQEFNKYDTTQQGVIPKDMTYPILQQLLLKNGLKEKKLRDYFSGPHYPKLLMDLQVVDETTINELQFLNLLAMVTRELTRKWLQKVRVQKAPKMTKAWSMTALDGSQMPAPPTEDFTSQSMVGIGQNTSVSKAGMPRYDSRVHQAKPRHVSTSNIGQQAYKPLKMAETAPKKKRRHTESGFQAAAHPAQQQQCSRHVQQPWEEEDDYDEYGEDDGEVFQQRQSSQRRSSQQRGGGRGEQELSRHSSAAESRRDRYNGRGEPEGRSHDDVSMASSRAGQRKATAGTKATSATRGHSQGYTHIPTAAQQQQQQRRPSRAPKTREEALTARQQLQEILRKEGAAVSTSDNEVSNDEEENHHDDQGSTSIPALRAPDQPAQAVAVPTAGDAPVESSADEDDEEDELSDSEEEDSEQLLEEGDEDEVTNSEREVEDMLISGNSVADAWMLY